MRWILVRHAAHLDGRLGEHGREQVDRLRAALELRHVRPTLYLVSTCSPAQQTCARLVETPSLRAVQASTAALAPADVPTRLDDLVVTAGAQLRQAATAVLIGHEGGLSDLLTELTGARHRPFPEAGAVSVTAGSVQDLLRGNGTVEFTVPVADHHEAELRSKVDSKKTVATLLAGFVLTALVGVLIEGPEWYERCISDNVTIVAFATSLAFFLAAVYVYDQLAMPAGFWTDGSRTRLRSRLAKTAGRRRERRWDRAVTAQTCYTWFGGRHRRWLTRARNREALLREHGPVFPVMVSAWTWLFTPGLLAALLGFGGLLWRAEPWVHVAAVLGVLAAGAAFLRRRPDLGAD